MCWQIIKYLGYKEFPTFRLHMLEVTVVNFNLDYLLHAVRKISTQRYIQDTGCLSLFWCRGKQNAFLYPLNWISTENWLYYVVLNGGCLPPFTAQFEFCCHRVAFMHSNDDWFFLSWLNATTVSINMFLSVPAACQVWCGMPLTQLFSSRPIHSWNVIYVSHTVSWRVYWEHCKSGQDFITER